MLPKPLQDLASIDHATAPPSTTAHRCQFPFSPDNAEPREPRSHGSTETAVAGISLWDKLLMGRSSRQIPVSSKGRITSQPAVWPDRRELINFLAGIIKCADRQSTICNAALSRGPCELIFPFSPDSPDEMAFGQLRAPIPDIRSNFNAGLGGRVLTDLRGERRKRQFRQHFHGLQSCRPNSFEESGFRSNPRVKSWPGAGPRAVAVVVTLPSPK